MKKNFGDYYLGLDMGTDSVGWAVTDLDYHLLSYKRRQMWGSRLFDGAETAEQRRLFRSSRRRLGRRHERMKLLEEIFSESISKIDPAFFIRMRESKYHVEDKRIEERFCVFADEKYTDKEYHMDFPTIYHLRKALIEGKKEYDIRLYFLAIHHIMKHRGHFLFEGQNMEKATSFGVVFDELVELMRDEYGLNLFSESVDKLSEIIKDRSLGITKKNSLLSKNLSLNFIEETEFEQDDIIDEIGAPERINSKYFIKLLSGGMVNLKDLFNNKELDELEVNKICFSNAKYDENILVLQEALPDDIYMIEKMKAIYDWGVLANVIGNQRYLSFSKVNLYNKHKHDLNMLKKIIREKSCFSASDYKDIFETLDVNSCNYAIYVGKNSDNGKNKPLEKRKDTSQEALCKFILKYLTMIPEEDYDDDVHYLIREASENTLLPKQVTKDNGVIPYQLHLSELKAILDNLVRDYPEFAAKDDSGYSLKEKIEKLFVFRIPYYVGPLNDAHANKEDYTKGNCWIAKRTNEKVTPWNFDDVVDREKCAERFIQRLTGKCTYLLGEDVLPKDSLLYSRFMLLNELNNLKIDQEPISVELKNRIYKDVFENEAIKGKVTIKKLKDYFEREGIFDSNEKATREISGIDGEVKSSLSSFHDMKKIFGLKINTDTEMIEDVILGIVVFGEDKVLLKARLKKRYVQTGRMTDEELKQVLRKRYVGWGRLSQRLLNGIPCTDKSTGETGSVIQMMQQTNCNFMQLLSANYLLSDEIKQFNDDKTDNVSGVTYDMVEELYASPSVKRMIWQTMSIIKDVMKVTGHAPKKVFVEMARQHANNGRKDSRKSRLLLTYKSIKSEDREWVNEIEGMSESDFRSIKRYLYYTQMGKCMYCGKIIDLDELFTTDTYDRDHIYPQSKTKDDSLDNLVLVCKKHNAEKSDEYPINDKYQNAMSPFWKKLKEKSLITKKKYERLVRIDPLSQEELAGFIARQIVETQQSTKAVAQMLDRVFEGTEVVYVKANNVSEFRRGTTVTKDNHRVKVNEFVKVREVNDYHHAQDAYLNIVVGNVYNTKFTKNPINFIKEAKPGSYSLNRMYNFTVERGGVLAWVPGREGTMKTVNDVMNQDLSKLGKIQFTRYAYEKKGGLFDQMLMKKGKGQVPIKGSNPRLSIEKYGGYNKAAGAYFMLVESDGKKGKIRTLESIPIYLAKQVEQNLQIALEYLTGKDVGLVNPHILVKKIKINSLLKVDGYPMHISGRTGKQIIMKGGVQLVLDYKTMLYIKKIVKYIKRNSESSEFMKIGECDGISEEENKRLYMLLLEKHKNPIYYKRASSQIKTLEKGFGEFCDLSIEKQSNVLYEILHIFQCKGVSANMKDIGGSEHAGKFLLSKEISKYNSVRLINQSPTGLYESEIDLLNI